MTTKLTHQRINYADHLSKKLQCVSFYQIKMLTRKLFLIYFLCLFFALYGKSEKAPAINFLLPDGTLNLCAIEAKQMVLDISGWRVVLDPERGPIFSSAYPPTEAWSALDKGLNSTVMAITVNGTDVYVAGSFDGIGTGGSIVTGLNNIAKWNGTAWSALDKGLNSTANSLLVSGTDIFVGGTFTGVGTGGIAVSGLNNIAKWNGTAWSALDKGLNSFVFGLASNGTDIYAGGNFTTVGSGGTPVVGINYIAKWNGTAWSALDKGLNDVAYGIAANGTNVYVGGLFTNVGTGGLPVIGLNSIGKWDGSVWSSLDQGLNNYVRTVAVSGSDVFVGGAFSGVGTGGIAVGGLNRIAKWNGNSWFSMDQGLSNQVMRITVSSTDIFVGGDFTSVGTGGIAVAGLNRVAKWNGTGWAALDKGVNSGVRAIAVSGTDVFAGGDFTNVGTGGTAVTGLNRIAKWGDPCPGGMLNTYYRDFDSDGYGNASITTLACTTPAGYVINSTDCNDSNNAIYPGTIEICNAVDDDCDGLVDEGVQTTFYRDADRDGYGRGTITILACTAPGGYVNNSSDCNDSNIAIYPGATEICNGIDDDCDGLIDEGVQGVYTTFYRDADGDGYGGPSITTLACTPPAGFVDNRTDCNDADNTIHPGATEICNAKDENCNGLVDEGAKTTFYRDADNDGYGRDTISILTCTNPGGYVINNTDCNDSNNAIYPGATEICNGIDDDCDGLIDEGVQAVYTTFYRDADADGYGNPSITTLACIAPAGYVNNSMDCNDSNNAVYPDATEICNGIDDDCDGLIDEEVQSTFYLDFDGDGYGNVSITTLACTAPASYVNNSTDCNDANNAIHPGAAEVCNALDDDCDGSLDEGVQTAFYRDSDADGYGNPSITTLACTPPAGYVNNSTDCNDANNTVYPGTTEICNGIDDDCDGLIDEGVQSTFYRDVDGDGYGNVSITTLACTAPAGYVNNSTDCNDANNAIHPGATEVCNGVDDDCDASVDEGIQTIFFRDVDGDGYGNAAVSTLACTAPVGYVNNSTDCNDANNAIHPGATEVCNALDDNCDGSVDEGVKTTFYRDVDADGYGNPSITTLGCTPPVGYVNNSADCNDANNAIHPGATEVCNALDDDCDGSVDEGVKTTFYRDVDGDGYGNASITILACTVPTGYVNNNADCNDTNSAIHPNATEICNGIDEDCNALTDEGIKSTFYRDDDGDGYGNASITTLACTAPAGYVINSADCNDANNTIHPGATEVCNAVDDDCDGSVDEGVKTTFYRDVDGDGHGNASITTLACTAPAGYVINSADCNDANNTIPNANEICNGIDEDCDGLIDEGVKTTFYRDVDGDGYGYPLTTILACTKPVGYVANNTDCNDSNNLIYPMATEICNEIDDDCDGFIDEGVRSIFYRDLDGDGYGDPSTVLYACSTPPGYINNNHDCNDANFNINPDAMEVCNGIDDDCDGSIDMAAFSVFYPDLDGDGFGSLPGFVNACSAPPGYVNNKSDCNDHDNTIYPGAIETCNGRDDNCDNLVDNGLPSDTLYRDVDGDGYGTGSVITISCREIAGYVNNKSDCNDTKIGIHPGAIEICNGIDDDCDGLVDEGVQTIFYRDADGDGYGNAAITIMACTSPAGYVNNNTDCNDTKIGIHLGAIEICNGIDDDCDGLIDEGMQSTCYRDADGDGYGNAAITIIACTAPVGYVNNSTDCNDANNAIHPGAIEICNGIDDDCDGLIQEDAQGISIDASASSHPVPIDSAATLSASVSPAAGGIPVVFKLDNGNGGITYYNAITNVNGIATITVTGLPVEVYLIIATAGVNCDSTIAYLPVYDPNGGFITGGGWINSPAGAFPANSSLTGKANFGFVAKYKKGNNQVDGNTEFQFHAGNLNFKSTLHDAGTLVISGPKATYRGVGIVNGMGNYGFLIAAIDGQINGGGGADKFRIKIWNKANGNETVYDNQINGNENEDASTVIAGGSIVIHEVKNNNFNQEVDFIQNIYGSKSKSESMLFDVKAYPNPTDQFFTLELKGGNNDKVRVVFYDAVGRQVMKIEGANRQQFIRLGEELKSGFYFIEVIQGENRKIIKLVKQNKW